MTVAAQRPAWAAPARAWLVFSTLLGAGALVAWWLPTPWLDFQPALAWSEPWRLLSAVWVHWSPLHLGPNLLAAAVVAAYGWAARMPLRATLAYAAAWPLTHLGLLLRPELAHYGGLSGVLHGGVAVVSVWLLATARGVWRTIGGAVMLGLVIKLSSESPWGPALQTSAEWDIAVVPLAHTTGALAGLLCAALALATRPASRASRAKPGP